MLARPLMAARSAGMLRFRFLLVLLLAGCAAAGGQRAEPGVPAAAEPERDPAAGPEREPAAEPERERAAGAALDRPPLVLGDHVFHRRRLANGLEALALFDDAGAHSGRATVHVVYGVGRRMEGPLSSGLAHLVEHAMFIGSRDVGPDEHDARLKALGAESNAFTRDDYTAFYGAGFPSAALEEVLELEADRMRGIRWEAGPYEHERGRLEREEARTHTAGDTREALLQSVVFRRHPYGALVPGPDGHTQAPRAPLAKARAFHELWYGPERAAVAVAGDVEPAQALDAIERVFGGLPRAGEVPPIPQEPADLPGGEARLPSDLLAERVVHAWVGPARREEQGGLADRLALEALARILARLAGRERAELDVSMGGRLDRDLFRFASAGEGAAERLLEWHARAVGEEVHEAELARETEAMVREPRELPRSGRPYFSLAPLVAMDHALGDPERLAERELVLSSLTPADLRDAARRWLAPERRWTIRFLPGAERDAELPEDRDELEELARRAAASGDHALSIAAYEELLARAEGTGNTMWTVIHPYGLAAQRVEHGDLEGAERDLLRALELVDYPAVRQLLEEVRRRRVGVHEPDGRAPALPPGGAR